MSIITLSTLRRRAVARGYHIWKVPERSLLYLDYGPYTLSVTASYAVQLRGVGMDELAAFLQEPARLSESATGRPPGADERRPSTVQRHQSRHQDGTRRLWTLDHLIRHQWSITNRSGYTARSVAFVASGALRISGSPDWTATVDQLGDGQGYGICATSAWGSTFHKPEIRVTWFSDDQPDQRSGITLHWPASAISFPGAQREGR